MGDMTTCAQGTKEENDLTAKEQTRGQWKQVYERIGELKQAVLDGGKKEKNDERRTKSEGGNRDDQILE